MSFDNYSDSDIPIEIDDLSAEIEKQKALIRQLGFALIEAWPMVHQPFTSTTRQNEVQRAMFAFREWCGPDDQPGMLPTLTVDRFNPWKDEIVIEGVTYKGEFFRSNERAQLATDAARYQHMLNNAVFQSRNGPGLYWYLPRTPDLHGLSEAEALNATIDANMKAKESK